MTKKKSGDAGPSGRVALSEQPLLGFCDQFHPPAAVAHPAIDEASEGTRELSSFLRILLRLNVRWFLVGNQRSFLKGDYLDRHSLVMTKNSHWTLPIVEVTS